MSTNEPDLFSSPDKAAKHGLKKTMALVPETKRESAGARRTKKSRTKSEEEHGIKQVCIRIPLDAHPIYKAMAARLRDGVPIATVLREQADELAPPTPKPDMRTEIAPSAPPCLRQSEKTPSDTPDASASKPRTPAMKILPAALPVSPLGKDPANTSAPSESKPSEWVRKTPPAAPPTTPSEQGASWRRAWLTRLSQWLRRLCRRH